MPTTVGGITTESIVRRDYGLEEFGHGNLNTYSIEVLRSLDAVLKKAIKEGSKIAEKNRNTFVLYLSLTKPDDLTTIFK